MQIHRRPHSEGVSITLTRLEINTLKCILEMIYDKGIHLFPEEEEAFLSIYKKITA